MDSDAPEPPAPRFYRDFASWWPLLSSPLEYADEAATYLRLLQEASGGQLGSVLELGSGGGNNASHLKAHVDLTLVDRSPGMLDVSRTLNPECRHLLGDMRTLRLGSTFDAVFLHDALAYLTTEADLRSTMRTAFEHCRAGGGALFVPDFVRESFRTGTDHGGHDGEGRALRYLAWTWDPDPDDATYVTDYAFVLREGEQVQVLHDRHVEGLFARATWLHLLHEVGFEARAARVRLDEVAGDVEVFVARRPGRGTVGPH